ncbi:hypothetical protein POSPLADRAFT_1031540 [Postia placenta MAD-698-R-SB12]|uniref:Uncharacterized protein n=1 Tax=Postia placenta MAD-698-R-SB12 TaxID=670580 RepID=A0A1X6ND64_9APHY|nr:hypothetical protein POSPLADRAFT_1031540 [Postia placenta MAD-698-R-SB12]OSX66568.1 hypothetical protein POSPLADRAFT_1031540 [Postia placenta MAD-698-R-SB12]
MFASVKGARATGRTFGTRPTVSHASAFPKALRLHRFQSTASGSSTAVSQVAAGATGGVVVLVGVYAWYHFSGAKTAVDASKAAANYYQETKRAIAENAPKNPNEVIEFLRKTTKSYAGLIPGASSYIDSTFDTLDQLHKTHGDDVNRVLQEGYDDIHKIIQESGNGVSVETGMKVMGVLRKRMSELEEVGKKVGQDVFKTLSEKHPEIKEKLGGSYEELKDMAEKSGPKAKKILDDTLSQVKDIFEKGFSPDSLSQAQKLVSSKVSEARKLAQSSGQGAWNEAVKQAQPYLDKVPEIKKLIEDNASSFMAAGVSQSKVVQEVFAKVKDAAEGGTAGNDQKMKELREFVEKKAHDVQGQGSGGVEHGLQVLQDWAKAMPGGEEMLKQAPSMSALMQLAQDRGDDAKKLTKEAYEDIVKVLEEKGKNARDLLEKSQNDVKRKS